jgi:HSP20 family protein
MPKEKKSFFERLTGTMRMDDRRDEDEQEVHKNPSSWIEEEEEDKDGELTVDVYQTADMIVVKAMIAGVYPEDLDISITRDLITIRGVREEERTAKDDDYFIRELYWGSFSRTITLPEEIDVDEAEAVEKHGLLILKLPKLDRKRQSKLKVKTI